MRPSIKYRSGYKYQILEAYTCATRIFPGKDITTPWIRLNTAGMITIKKGFAWDGPSGPTFDTKTFMRGSLVHDALYQLIRDGHLEPSSKARADELIREMCLEDGMGQARAWWVYQAVSRFGASSTMPSGGKSVEIAP